MACNRRTPDWSNLPSELLEFVLKKLSFDHVFRFKLVCSSWRSVAKSSLSSPSPHLNPPLLMVPTDHQEYDYGYSFFNLADEKVGYDFSNLWGSDQSRCIGSSQGWLIFHDKQGGNSGLFIFFNLFEIDIRTMKLPSLPYSGRITKIILTSNPIPSSEKIGVVIIYGSFSSKLAFSMSGGDTKWVELDQGSHKYSYMDVICNNDHLFALSEVGTIEVWEFRDLLPVKKTSIKALFSDKVVECEKRFKNIYTNQMYLVESRGDFFLVTRWIGEFVREDGEVISEGGLLDDEELSHLDCHYMTKNFYVYKLDLLGNRWVKVESLGDYALFLGGNQSRCVSALDFQECKGNSIYFTDDYWYQMDEDDMYGGHDMGVFDLEDGSITQIFPTELMKIGSAAFWLV